MIVAQEDRVKLTNFSGWQRRYFGLDVFHRAVSTWVLGWRVEGWVCENTKPVKFDEDGRPPNEREPNVRGRHWNSFLPVSAMPNADTQLRGIHEEPVNASEGYAAGPER